MKNMKTFEDFVFNIIKEDVQFGHKEDLIKYLKKLKTAPRKDTVFKVDGRIVTRPVIDKMIDMVGVKFNNDDEKSGNVDKKSDKGVKPDDITNLIAKIKKENSDSRNSWPQKL
jgi:hypothetical protein